MKLFLQEKYKIFERWRFHPRTSATAPSHPSPRPRPRSRFLATRLHTLTCKEKIDLKIEWKDCGKTFSPLAFTVFSFQIALKTYM